MDISSVIGSAVSMINNRTQGMLEQNALKAKQMLRMRRLQLEAGKKAEEEEEIPEEPWHVPEDANKILAELFNRIAGACNRSGVEGAALSKINASDIDLIFKFGGFHWDVYQQYDLSRQWQAMREENPSQVAPLWGYSQTARLDADFMRQFGGWVTLDQRGWQGRLSAHRWEPLGCLPHKINATGQSCPGNPAQPGAPGQLLSMGQPYGPVCTKKQNPPCSSGWVYSSLSFWRGS